MRSGRSSAIAACIFLLGTMRVQAIALVVQPNKLDLTARAGAQLDQDIAISTIEAHDTNVKLAIESFTLDLDGHPTHHPSVSSDRWVALPVHDAVIHNGQKFLLRLRLTIPENATGTSWCALLIETPPEEMPGQFEVRTRVAVPIFVTAEGTESASAKIEAVDAMLASSKDIVVGVRIRNRGNTVLRAPMTIAIEQDLDGQPVELVSAEQPEFIILPGSVRVMQIRIHGHFEAGARLTAAAFYRYREVVESASGRVHAIPSPTAPAI